MWKMVYCPYSDQIQKVVCRLKSTKEINGKRFDLDLGELFGICIQPQFTTAMTCEPNLLVRLFQRQNKITQKCERFFFKCQLYLTHVNIHLLHVSRLQQTLDQSTSCMKQTNFSKLFTQFAIYLPSDFSPIFSIQLI